MDERYFYAIATKGFENWMDATSNLSHAEQKQNFKSFDNIPANKVSGYSSMIMVTIANEANKNTTMCLYPNLLKLKYFESLFPMK